MGRVQPAAPPVVLESPVDPSLEPISSKVKISTCPVSELVDKWNELAEETGLPGVDADSKTRLGLWRTRWKEWVKEDGGGLPTFDRILAAVRASPYLLGKTDIHFTGALKFLLRNDQNWRDILAGTQKGGSGKGELEDWQKKAKGVIGED